MLPKTVEEVLAHAGGLDIRLTEDEQKFIKNNAGARKIIVTNKDDKQKGYCLCCEKRVVIPDKIKHTTYIKCPSCNENVEVHHIWRNMWAISDKATIYIYRRSRTNPQAIVAILLLCRRFWQRIDGQDIEKARFEVEEVDNITVFMPGEGGMQIKPLRGAKAWGNVYDCSTGKKRAPAARYEIEKRAPRCRENIYQESGYYNCYAHLDQLQEITAGTPFSYGLNEYLPYAEDACIGYLHRVHRWPAYEWLCKMGLGALVGRQLKPDKAWHEYGVPFVNWRGKTLQKILKVNLTKAEKRFLLDKEKKHKSLNPHQLANMLEIKQRYPELPLDALTHLTALDLLKYQHAAVENSLKDIPLQKLARYAQKQGRLSLRNYTDYLDQLEILHIPRNKKTLYPKDFAAEHTRLSERIKLKESMEYEAKYHQRRRELHGLYHYADDEYCIICPPKVSMLIKEGELQHNCVATYMKRVSEGNTNVVFLRKKTDWRTPLGTVEINNDGHVVQARAAYNKPLPETARAFVAKFAETVKKRIAENKKKGKKAA